MRAILIVFANPQLDGMHRQLDTYMAYVPARKGDTADSIAQFAVAQASAYFRLPVNKLTEFWEYAPSQGRPD
jgi:hypothetical protein